MQAASAVSPPMNRGLMLEFAASTHRLIRVTVFDLLLALVGLAYSLGPRPALHYAHISTSGWVGEAPKQVSSE